MKISVTKKKAHEVAADLTVVPVSEGAESGSAVKELSSEARQAVARRIKMVSFKAKAGKTLSVQTTDGDVVLVARSTTPLDGLAHGDEAVCLRWQTWDATAYRGCDAIRIISKHDERKNRRGR